MDSIAGRTTFTNIVFKDAIIKKYVVLVGSWTIFSLKTHGEVLQDLVIQKSPPVLKRKDCSKTHYLYDNQVPCVKLLTTKSLTHTYSFNFSWTLSFPWHGAPDTLRMINRSLRAPTTSIVSRVRHLCPRLFTCTLPPTIPVSYVSLPSRPSPCYISVTHRQTYTYLTIEYRLLRWLYTGGKDLIDEPMDEELGRNQCLVPQTSPLLSDTIFL